MVRLKIIFPICVMLALAISCATKKKNRNMIGEIITVSNEEFARVISDRTVQLVDVRTRAEYDEGHIPSASIIDVLDSSFCENIKQLDKNRIIAVYCRSGRRSLTASDSLIKRGFLKVYNLEKGFNEWNGAKE